MENTIKDNDGKEHKHVSYKITTDEKDIWSIVDNTNSQNTVEIAEPVYKYFTSEESVPSAEDNKGMDKQWYLKDQKLESVWSNEGYGNTAGEGVVVAVIDTGVDYNHEDLQDNIWTNSAEVSGQKGTDDDNNGYVDDVHGINLIDPNETPMDDHGHGTHVAGILAGDGTASDRRYQGVAPGCHLVAAKVLDRRGNGRLQDVLRALQWISFNQNLYGIRIINISVGAAAMDSKAAARLIKAVEQAWDQGFVVVTAAGNMGPAYGSVTAPGSSKKVITVGASDMLDRISSVSGAGPTAECVCKPDLVAPGADVISCANKRNSYAIKSGTSMSTPRVSGAIALLLQKDPFLTNVEVKMLLRESCLDLGYPRNRQGWGKLDIQKLLAL